MPPQGQVFLSKYRRFSGLLQGKKGSQKGQPAKRGRGATSLKDLVDSGILAPGRNKITVIYKGITYAASLQPDGLIAYQGSLSVHNSASGAHHVDELDMRHRSEATLLVVATIGRRNYQDLVYGI